MKLIVNNLENTPIMVDSLSESIRKDPIDGLVRELTLTTSQVDLNTLQTIFTPITSIENIQIFNTSDASVYTSTQYKDYPNINANITDTNNNTYISFKVKI